MNPFQRVAVTLLESIGSVLWGFKPNMMRYFVLEYGAGKSVIWFVKNMPRYEKILKTHGPMRTHFLSTAISILHGCPYCTFGHAYALQLHYLNDTNRLFPLNDEELASLHNLPEAEVYSRLTTALNDADLQNEVQWLDKLALLRSMTLEEQRNVARTSRDDADVCHLIQMFAVLNACGITHQVIPDEAHDPINKDKALQVSYERLRAD